MYKKSLLNHTKLYLGPFNLNWAILTYSRTGGPPCCILENITHTWYYFPIYNGWSAILLENITTGGYEVKMAYNE